jgi:predicted house-cleaning noncanonical NTP pyrophosphatase (MazG superfamily)
MSEIVHNKLVRDNIPTIVEAGGNRPVARVLDMAEYRQELLKKLVEEATELLESDGSLEERIDVAEVLLAIDELLGLDAHTIEQARAKKAEERGGFYGRVFLEKVIQDREE